MGQPSRSGDSPNPSTDDYDSLQPTPLFEESASPFLAISSLDRSTLRIPLVPVNSRTEFSTKLACLSAPIVPSKRRPTGPLGIMTFPTSRPESSSNVNALSCSLGFLSGFDNMFCSNSEWWKEQDYYS